MFFVGTGSVMVVSLLAGPLPEQIRLRSTGTHNARAWVAGLKSRAIGKLFEEGLSERLLDKQAR